jgi:hypothetical protein
MKHTNKTWPWWDYWLGLIQYALGTIFVFLASAVVMKSMLFPENDIARLDEVMRVQDVLRGSDLGVLTLNYVFCIGISVGLFTFAVGIFIYHAISPAINFIIDRLLDLIWKKPEVPVHD